MVSCERFRSADTAAVVGLIARVFSESEPPAVAMRLTRGDFERFVGALCPKAAADGLTVVARAGETNEIVGVLLTDDFAEPPEFDVNDLNEKMLPILAMLDGLDEEYRKRRVIRPGQYLHLFMLAVDPKCAGRGVAQQLVAACLANGREKGYTMAITEATGVVSQHVFRKLGFADRFRTSYQDYRYHGRPVFASIRGHDATILMDRDVTQNALG